MHAPKTVLAALLIVGSARAQDADEQWQIQGQVVDEPGAPVEDFEAATYWSSSGNLWDETGKRLEGAGTKKFGGDEGMLAASPKNRAKRQPGGRFSFTIDGMWQVSVFVVDGRRERGGMALVDRSAADKPITITLVPLVRVTAEVYCSEADKTPDWSNVRVYPVGDKGPHLAVTSCASYRGKASFLLPPGTYDLLVHCTGPEASLPAPKGQRGLRVTIPDDQTAYDLGVIDVPLPRDANGIVRDYSQFYGKEPPELAITDARGVPKDVKLAGFRGKWVLLEFWGVGCAPCVGVGGALPKLTKFYEEHAADRDRFEILSICDMGKEKVRTVQALEALMAPVVEKDWAGKQLPFPVLIDDENKTNGVYGIIGYPTELLIDPEGHLVPVGPAYDTPPCLEYLAEKLSEK